ncbi:recombinase family protein [Amycolatopsis vastitatis]|uniref:Recombinase n=1 Tax=Amycolatopsis vastitatis TaxID=1905142 RepID=A0A229SNB1_9PSEU|nr:recombinase family protein [Amycolatopsis vastitatis]OXM60507.1 recombinase [Amycolatopsis vastitatis]
MGIPDLLSEWGQGARQRLTHRPHQQARGAVRFAFYGRTSTVEHQDPVSSAAWQREAAETLIAGRGLIVTEYFDAGCSRRLPWRDRPEAAALLTALHDPGRGFDAIVVGEYERAFAADQFEQLAPTLTRHGVQVWLPEAGGPVEAGSPLHRMLMTVLGAQSQREVLRARHRTLAAMRAQVRMQGRYLGGRPPYGYRLVDAGPHPNRTHAGWGRRLQRLDPDPVTAPHVKWIFAKRLSGRSAASIARELNERGVPSPSALNERGVPSPSAADPGRNRHRSGQTWSLRTIVEILRNPRYTGREAWDRVPGRNLQDPQAPRGKLTIAAKPSHPALVSERDFVAAQAVQVTRTASDGTRRVYQLSGLVRCGSCGRRMDSHWINDRPGYRCRHGYTSAQPRPATGAKNLYLREDELLARIATHLHAHGGPAHDVAAYLRAQNLTINCDAETLTLGSAGDQPTGPARPHD